MFNIRRGTFETNSSSTHSICIACEDENIKIPEKIEIDFNKNSFEFDWSYKKWSTIEEKLAYLIMGIFSRSGYYTSIGEAGIQMEKLLNKLKNIGVKEVKIKGVEFTLYGDSTYIDYNWDSYVDHATELGELIDTILVEGRDDLLKNYLFSNKSFILGGNDNDERGFPDIDVDYDYIEVHKGN